MWMVPVKTTFSTFFCWFTFVVAIIGLLNYVKYSHRGSPPSAANGHKRMLRLLCRVVVTRFKNFNKEHSTEGDTVAAVEYRQKGPSRHLKTE